MTSDSNQQTAPGSPARLIMQNAEAFEEPEWVILYFEARADSEHVHVDVWKTFIEIVCDDPARSYTRGFNLPCAVDSESDLVEARVRNGVLTLKLPRLNPDPHAETTVYALTRR